MNFLNPNLLLAGLACISLPIIVHLLTRRRRRPVEWGAMRFLLEAYRKHKRRLTLEQFLLLAARCLLVALVALALGKPILGTLAGTTGPGPRTVVLAVDNGLTSGLLGSDGRPALATSIDRARALLDTLDQARGDRAGLIALGAPSQSIVLPPSTDIAGVKRQLESLEITDSRADLAAAAAQVRTELIESAPTSGARVVLALFGDWRAGSTDVDHRLPLLSPEGTGADRPLVLATPPAPDSVDNVSVVGIEPLRNVLLANSDGAIPSEASQVRVLLKRVGPAVERSAASIVSVKVDRADRPTPDLSPTQTTATWSAGQRELSVPVTVAVPSLDAGTRPLVTASIDQDAIPGDNVFRRPVELRRLLQIGVVSARQGSGGFGAVDWVRLSLRPDVDSVRSGSELRVVEIEPRSVAAPGQLTGVDALFIVSPELLDRVAWEKAAAFCSAGGLVMVFAQPAVGAQLWTDDFVQTFGLPWTIARESKSLTPPALLADPLAASKKPDPDLLALLSGEITELVRPVRVSRILPIDSAPAGISAIMSLADGTPFLAAARPGRDTEGNAQVSRGLVVFLASAPDTAWTDLPTKPLMLPLIQEVTRQGIGAARSQWMSTAGHGVRTPVGAVEIRPLTNVAVPMPASSSGITAGVRRAGVWAATDARGATLELLAVNPDTAASDTTPRSREDINAWLAGLAGEDRFAWMESSYETRTGAGGTAAALPMTDHAPPISPDLLLAALAVALAEMGMARWFSHAAVSGGAAAPQAGGGT